MESAPLDNAGGNENESPIEQIEEKTTDNTQNPKRGGFAKRARDAAKIMLFASALSTGPGLVQDSNAQNLERNTKIEDTTKNITESGSWSQVALDKIKKDLKMIKTEEDANWLANDISGIFREFYFPSKGVLEDNKVIDGLKKRIYTQEDRLLYLQNAKEAKEILIELNGRFKINGFEKIVDQADDMLKKLEVSTSYSAQRERERMEKLEKMFP